MPQGVTLFPKKSTIFNFPRNSLSFSKADLTLMDVILIPAPKLLTSHLQWWKRVAGSGIQMSETCLQLGCGNLGWDPAPNKQPPPSHRFDTFPPPPKWVPFNDQIGQLSWWSCFADGFLERGPRARQGPLLFCVIPV